MDKLKFETPDLAAENLKKLEALFPSAITEMRGQNGTIRKGVNFELLKQLLSPDVVDGEECYELNWVGKRAAMAEAAQPITKTLRPMQEDSRDWDKTENLYLEGDNLDVLKILQESYLGQVKMIYIDPPYNTGHDFLYRDKYQRSQREENEQMGMYDEEENRLFENTESNGKFHSDWCSILYARLLVCRNLLRDDGVIFISIDNNEFANLRSICDSVFGRSSFVSVLHVQMSTVQGQKVRAAKAGNIVKNAEMVLIYSKNGNKTIGLRPMLDAVKYDNHYNKILRPNPDGSYRETPLTDAAAQEPEIVEELRLLELADDGKKLSANALQDYYEYAPKFRSWVNAHARDIVRAHDSIDVDGASKQKMEPDLVYPYSADKRDYLIAKNASGQITQRIRLSDKLQTADDFYGTYGPTTIRGDWWSGFYIDMGNVSKEGGVNYDNGKKPVRLIQQLITFCTGAGDIVLDFFAGSATTAHAVMLASCLDGQKRRFIMVQLDEDLDKTYRTTGGAAKASARAAIRFLDELGKPHLLSEVGKERIRRAGDKLKAEYPQADLDFGFRVFRLDESNMKDVYFHPEEYTQEKIGGMISNIKEDRTELDLLYSCLLDWGVEIHLPHTCTVVEGCAVHNVDSGALVACFRDKVPESVVRFMAAVRPLRAVFRDSAFPTDAEKINVTEIFKSLSPATKVKVI